MCWKCLICLIDQWPIVGLLGLVILLLLLLLPLLLNEKSPLPALPLPASATASALLRVIPTIHSSTFNEDRSILGQPSLYIEDSRLHTTRHKIIQLAQVLGYTKFKQGKKRHGGPRAIHFLLSFSDKVEKQAESWNSLYRGKPIKPSNLQTNKYYYD